MQECLKFGNNFVVNVSKFGKMIDFVFGNLLVFLIAFVWTRFFWTDNRINFCVSLVVMILVCLTYNFIFEKKSKKIELSAKQEQNANAIVNGFLLSEQRNVLEIFAQNFAKKYPVTKQNGFLIVNGNIFLPFFDKLEICDKDVLYAFYLSKKFDCKKVVIACNALNKSAIEAENLVGKKIVILDKASAYKNIFLPLGFDVPKIEEQTKRKNINEVFAKAFNKGQTKNYLIVALFLLFSGFVMRYNVYYLIFASINGVFALYSHYNKKYNTSQSMQYFEK